MQRWALQATSVGQPLALSPVFLALLLVSLEIRQANERRLSPATLSEVGPVVGLAAN